MTIGKRKGAAAKGAGAAPGNDANSKFGGALSKNDHWYIQQAFGMTGDPGTNPEAIKASGGIVNDYSEPTGNVYRAHIFTGSGTFSVESLSVDAAIPDALEYMCVGGGGGGGGPSDGNRGGGGGAGGFRSNFPGVPSPWRLPALTAVVQDYPITVGAGGAGNITGHTFKGSNSSFNSPTAVIVEGFGGGGGGNRVDDPSPGQRPANSNMSGGSGGGGGSGPGGGDGGNHQAATDAYAPTQNQQGRDGGNGYGSPPAYGGAGGGGAGGEGADGSSSSGGAGGDGWQVIIAEPPATPAPLRMWGADDGYFAAGGGGGAYTTPETAGSGGTGGGGSGSDPSINTYDLQQSTMNATISTGSGGGGRGAGPIVTGGGSGASGIVVVRYQIASGQTKTAKATGGNISFYSGKTIHTFTSSGTFTAPGTFSETVEYAILGGGGAGGYQIGGGGGAGGFLRGTTPVTGPSATTVAVGAGGGRTNNGSPKGYGSNSTFDPTVLVGYGGGGGGADGPPGTSGGPGGSGGGASVVSSPGSGDFEPGSPTSPIPAPLQPQGNPGGNGWTDGVATALAGGGGGAGGAGSNSPTGPAPSDSGAGGAGVQIPTTFQNPEGVIGRPGPGGTAFWVAGGGGGGGDNRNTPPGASPPNGGGEGGGPGGPYAGAGDGENINEGAGFGVMNTGSGGGGGAHAGSGNPYSPAKGTGFGGGGGSGIVLIAYPT